MPNFLLELAHDGSVCGIDEVGRGPLAGPVVAACVYIPPESRGLPFWSDVNDSKKINRNNRLKLDSYIKNHCIWGIAQASVEEIDRINILQATFLAMERAYEQMIERSGEDDPHAKRESCRVKRAGGGDYIGLPNITPSTRLEAGTSPFQGEDSPLALLDGNRAPHPFPIPVKCVIRGDATSLSIAAASIIAKVARDALMTNLHIEFPEYGWNRNAGYGTAAHLAALRTHGPCPHHRQSFAPVRRASALVI